MHFAFSEKHGSTLLVAGFCLIDCLFLECGLVMLKLFHSDFDVLELPVDFIHSCLDIYFWLFWLFICTK